MPTEGDQAKKSKTKAEPQDPIQAAADYGIDVQQLRDNRALPVAERLRRHQIALKIVELLQKAKRVQAISSENG